MTAATVMDIISRLPGCSGQAVDAVYRLYAGQNGRCTNIIENSKVRASRHLDTSTEAQMAQITSDMEDPVGLLERNLYGDPLAGLSREKQFEKVLLQHGWEKVLNWECLFVNRAKGLFLSVYVDDIKIVGRTENIKPTWKILMKNVDLGEPTTFIDHVYLGCTQRECKISDEIVENTEICSNPGFLVESRKDYLSELQGNLMQKLYLLGPTTWNVLQRNVWKILRTCE